MIYKKYEGFIKENYRPIFVFLVLSVPFVFLGALKIVYCFLPGVEVGEISDWISFGGTYLGAIVAVGGIAYQIKSTEKNRVFLEEKQLKETYNFLKFYLNNLKKDFNLIKSNLTKILNSSDSSRIDMKKLFSEGKMIIEPKLDDYFLEQIKKISGEKIGTELIELYIRTQNFEEVLKIFGEEDFLKSGYLKEERKLFCEIIENYGKIISGLDNYLEDLGYGENLGYDLKFSEETKSLIKEIKKIVIRNKRIEISRIKELIEEIDSIEFKEEYSSSFGDLIFPEKNKDKVSLMGMIEKINIYSEINKITDEEIRKKFMQLFYLYIPEDYLNENEKLYIPNFQIYEEFIENIIKQITDKMNEIDKKYGLK